MTGSSVFDYIHQADHSELAEQLGLGLTQLGQGMASPAPSSAGSEEGSSNVGTANPDGEFPRVVPVTGQRAALLHSHESAAAVPRFTWLAATLTPSVFPFFIIIIIIIAPSRRTEHRNAIRFITEKKNDSNNNKKNV